MEIREEILADIEKSIVELEKKHNLSFDEILNILKKRNTDQSSRTLPVSIFNNDCLSALEAISKYLKENLGLNYKEIATLLNRNYHPIAITYRKARKKMPRRLDVSSANRIPINIFRNKKFSILENLTAFLKEKMMLNYHEIAILLNRDDRTIWTVYQRKKRKWRR